jgi:hypothetical protein
MRPFPQQDFSDVHAVKCELAGDALRASGCLRVERDRLEQLPAVLPGELPWSKA